MDCEVCCGDGRYPILTRYGETLYTIACPECMGSGMNEAEREHEADLFFDQRRYDAAMVEKRAALTKEPE